MEALHARYPFLPAARESVGDADLAELIDEDGPVVDRAVERVERAIESRTVGEPHRSARVELLSYPVARVLVSLVAEPALTRRYASAEGRTAIERLRADRGDGELRSVARERLSLESFLEALGLAETVRPTSNGYTVAVATYLRLADGVDGESWRLVSRALADGRVPVTGAELDDLLAAAVTDRVAADLPVSVPAPVSDALEDPVTEIRSRLSDFSVDRSIDAVEPALFPPCITALAERLHAGEALGDHSQFAYVAFLAAIGMDAEEIAESLGGHPAIDASQANYRVDHLVDGDDVAYLPPSCATMQAYGDCVNQDQLCARIAHPLEYYERRLDGAEPGQPQASRPESQ